MIILTVFLLRLLSHIPAFAGAGNGSDTGTGLWIFTYTGIAGTVGQFVFFSDRRVMCLILIDAIFSVKFTLDGDTENGLENTVCIHF